VELRHLRSFVAVAEDLHFGRAATRLHLSPPAITAHIQHLERELRVTLFSRTPVGLTQAGADLLERARRTLAEADAAAAAMAAHREQPRGCLRVGILSNGAGELGPAVLREFMVANPRVDVSVWHLSFTDHLQALLQMRIDVAFVRPAPMDDRLDVTGLAPDPRVAVLAAGHPLAEADRLRTNLLLDQPFVRVADETPQSFREYFYLSVLRNGEAVRHSPAVARDVLDVLVAVAAGRGVASAADSFARSHRWPGVEYVPIDDAPHSMNTLVRLRDCENAWVDSFVQTATTLAVEWREAGAPGAPNWPIASP
jgi:DNA-binding transcriptional LysR family regulator